MLKRNSSFNVIQRIERIYPKERLFVNKRVKLVIKIAILHVSVVTYSSTNCVTVHRLAYVILIELIRLSRGNDGSLREIG
jgi:succinylarginine dihydrolase